MHQQEQGLSVITTAPAQLALKTLEVQHHLIDWDKMNHPQIKNAIEGYEKSLKELKAHRMSFTKLLDEKKAELMQPEKELEINADYLHAIEKERAFRLEAEKAERERYNKEKEVSDFKTHFINEFHRLAAKYRSDMMTVISNFYTSNLDAGTPNPEYKLLHAVIDEIKIGQPNKLEIKFNDREYMQNSVWPTIPKPDWADIKKKFCDEVIAEKFATYQYDLANAKVIIEQEQIQVAAKKQELSEELNSTIAVNTLLASAEVAEIKSEVKRKKFLILDAQNPTHVVAVMSAFLQHFQKCMGKVRVKDYTKLNIQQMADALDKSEIELTNMQYREDVD